MRKFVGYAKNDNFSVGCTGQTVYVYDVEGEEVGRFKDIKYGYKPLFCPHSNKVVVKSTAGMFAIYCLDTMKLIKKFRYSKVDAGQDQGFCFSPDGKYLYNIEKAIDENSTRLSIYKTADFNCIKQLFEDNELLELSAMECDTSGIYLLGYFRDEEYHVKETCFVAQLDNDILKNVTILDENKFDFLRDYKSVQMMGFTSEAFETSFFKLNYFEESFTLEKLKSLNIKLSDYIKTDVE